MASGRSPARQPARCPVPATATRYRRAVRRDGRLARPARTATACPRRRPRRPPAGRCAPSAGPSGAARHHQARAAAGRVHAVAVAGRRRARRSAGPGRAPGRAASASVVRRARASVLARRPPRRRAAAPRRRVAHRPADEVHAPVHAVGEVDVDPAGRAEHHRVARRSRPGRRASRGRRSPSYASTSVSRTATRPAGAAVLDGGTEQVRRDSGPAGRRTPGAAAAQPRTGRPGGVLVAPRRRERRAARRPGPAPCRRGWSRDSSAPRTVSTDRTSGVSRSSTDRRPASSTSHSSQLVLVAVADQLTGDLVRVAERNAGADQPLGDVGRQRVPGRGRGAHAARRVRRGSRPCRPSRAARAAAARRSRRPAPCPPAGRGRRRAAGP